MAFLERKSIDLSGRLARAGGVGSLPLKFCGQRLAVRVIALQSPRLLSLLWAPASYFEISRQDSSLVAKQSPTEKTESRWLLTPRALAGKLPSCLV